MQTIERIKDRFWYQTPVSETDRPILGVVAGDKKTLMIDAGNSEAHAEYFLSELSKKGVPMPDLAVLTHWHWDHIFGLSALTFPSISSQDTKAEINKLLPYSWSDEALNERVQSGIEIEFCANAIRQEYQEKRDIQVVLPTMAFSGQLEIDLGGVTCVLKQVGGDHSADSVVVYIKEEKILFLGDCIYANLYSEKRHYTSDIIRLLDELDQFDAEYYVLSHWKPVSRVEFEEEARLLRTAARLAKKAQGNLQEMTKLFEKEAGRSLTEDEQEVIQEFADGYGLEKKKAEKI